MELQQLVLGGAEGGAPFASGGARHAAVRAIARVVGKQLRFYNVVPDAAHVVVAGSRTRAGRWAQALSLAMAPTVDVPLTASKIEAVDDFNATLLHLVRLAPEGGLDHHPALWTGSALQDLVGARIVPKSGLAPGSLDLAPGALLGAAGINKKDIAPAVDSAVRSAGAARIRDAAVAALAVHPDLPGRPASVVLARRAAAAVANEVNIALTEVSWALGRSERQVRRLYEEPIDPLISLTVRTRIALEDTVRRAPVSAAWLPDDWSGFFATKG